MAGASEESSLLRRGEGGSDEEDEDATPRATTRRPRTAAVTSIAAVTLFVGLVLVFLRFTTSDGGGEDASMVRSEGRLASDTRPAGEYGFLSLSPEMNATSRIYAGDAGPDCWASCGQTAGFCDWCGEGLACCRSGALGSTDPEYCAGHGGSGWHHECVRIPYEAGGECHGYGCPAGYACKAVTPAYSECQLADAVREAKQPYRVCGGYNHGLAWQVSCTDGYTCTNLEPGVSRCLPSRLMNPGQDCRSKCMGAGACSWCGHNNACCKYGEDDPPECRGVHLPNDGRYVCTVSTYQPEVSHRGQGCFYQCNGPGDCSWCGDGNACCRGDGWWPDPPECMEVTDFSKMHDHVCVKPVRDVKVKHQRQDCWKTCGGAGFCDWCGDGNACCRFGSLSDPLECQGVVEFSATNKHVCVEPVVRTHHVRITPSEPFEVIFNGVAFGDHGKVRGVAGQGGHMDQLWMAGADAIRTWTLEQTVGALEVAQKHGLKVAAGVYITQDRSKYEGAYCELNNGWWQQEAQKIVAAVMRYSRHASLLWWLIGNEIELRVDWASGSDCLWRRLEWLVAKVKSADKYHPVGYAMAGYHALKVARVAMAVTSLDFLGLNVYGGDAANLHSNLWWAGWRKPYCITEYGSGGAWMVPTTPWGAPVEGSSSQKGYQYKQAYNLCLADTACIGTFMFLWGWKWEGTPTWFGLFNEWRAAGVDEAVSEVVDVIHKAYTGRESSKPAPSIAAVKVFDAEGRARPPGVGVFVEPGALMRVEVTAVEYPQDDAERWRDNEVVWVVAQEPASNVFSPAGDKIWPAIPGIVRPCGDKNNPRSQLSAVVDTSKLQKGQAYRLYVFVRDNVNAPGNEPRPAEASCCPTCKEVDPVVDKECDEAIRWAMSTGIHEHPEWYPSLRPNSLYDAFHRHFYTKAQGNCPQPCEPTCHDPVIGEECDTTVRWTIDQGVNLHPDWYPGLTPTSNYREAQQYFHDTTGECPRPCKKRANVTEAYANVPFKLCYDAEGSGDACEDMVLDAMRYPLKYGLSGDLSFRDVQKAMAKMDNETCTEPCDQCRRAAKGSTCEMEIFKVNHDILGVLQSPYSASFPWTSFDGFQGTLHRFGKSGCPQPCAMRLPRRGAPVQCP